MTRGRKPRVETCYLCGHQWTTATTRMPPRCWRCASRAGMGRREPDMSGAEIDRIMDEAIANETRMPWDKRK